MPAGTIQHHHGERIPADPAANFLQMQVHGVDVGVRQHEPGADAPGRTNGAKQVGTFVPLIAWRGRPAAALGPNTGQAAFLSNARFVLPPQLNRLALRGRRNDGGDKLGKVYGMARPSSLAV